MVIDGGVVVPVTSAKSSTGNAWASVAASAGKLYQLVGYSGGASSHACQVEVWFGSTLKLRHFSSGKTGSAVSEFLYDIGPITVANEALIIRTTTQPGGGNCYANLLYRIVL